MLRPRSSVALLRASRLCLSADRLTAKNGSEHENLPPSAAVAASVSLAENVDGNAQRAHVSPKKGRLQDLWIQSTPSREPTVPVRDWRVLEDAVLRAEGTNLIQLDRECVDLLRSMVAEKTEGMDPVKENKSQLLSLGRRWVKVNRGRFRYKDITYGDVIQKSLGGEIGGRQFLQHLVATFVCADRIDLLQPSEFAFLMHVVGRLRDFPGITDKKKFDGNGTYIPDFLVRKMRECLSVNGGCHPLSLFEVGAICHGIYMSGMRLHTRSQEVNTLLLERLRDLDEEAVLKDEQSFSPICKLVKNRGTKDFALSEQIIAKFTPIVAQLQLKTQTRLLGGLTLTRVANYERMVREFGRSLASRTDWKACRIKEIEQSVFILFFLNWTSYKGEEDYVKMFKEKIFSSMNDITEGDPRDGRSRVFLYATLAKMGIIDPAEINSFFSLVNSSSALKEATTETELLEAGIDVLFQLGISSCQRVARENAENLSRLRSHELRRTWRLYLSALFNMTELDFNIEMDFKNYEGERLDPQLRDKFRPLIDFYEPESWAEHFRRKIAEELKTMYGQDYVYTTKLMPHATYSDIVLRFSESGDGKTLEPIEKHELKLLSTTLGDFSSRCVAVVLPKRDHFDGSNRALGPLNHKLSQLERLYSRVALVNHFRYQHYARADHTKSYLTRILTGSSRRV